MGDYRDDHSPDIALLLTMARVLRHILESETKVSVEADIKALDDALLPFAEFRTGAEDE